MSDNFERHTEYEAAKRAAAIFAQLPAAFCSEDAAEHEYLRGSREQAIEIAEVWRKDAERMGLELAIALKHAEVEAAERRLGKDWLVATSLAYSRHDLVELERKAAELEAA